MTPLKNILFFAFFLFLFACTSEDKENVELVPKVNGEIRLISSKGINPSIDLHSAVLNGDYAYLTVRSWTAAANEGGIYVYSIAGLDGVTTRNIKELRYIAAPHQTVTMARSADYLFVGGEGGFSVFDISDPAKPVILNTVSESANLGLKIYDQTLYVIETQTIKLYDISTASSPTYLTTINAAGFNAAISNGYVYSGAGINTSFTIRDLNTPTVIAATVPLTGVPYHIEVLQNFLVVVANTTSASSLKVYSLADQVNVALTDQRDYAFPMKAFAANGQTMVLSGPDSGEILQISAQGTLSVLHTIDNGSATTLDGFPYFAAIEPTRTLIAGDDYALLFRF